MQDRLRMAIVGVVAVVALAAGVATQAQEGAPIPARGPFEEPLEGGYCAHVDGECFALRANDELRLDASTLGFGIASVEVLDEGHFLFQEDFTQGASITAPLGADLVYAVFRVSLSADTPHAGLADLPWSGPGPLTASFDVELYRYERAAVAAWLAAAVERSRPLRRDGCPIGEVPYPLHALARDLDGDGRPEGVTTLGTVPAPDWFCRWTDVHTVDANPTTIGLVAHGWPYVDVRDLATPTGGTQTVISSHFECCDLDQTFTVSALRDGSLVPLFDNGQVMLAGTPVSGYGMWHRLPDGRPVIAFTTDVEAYNYGQPASLDGFTLLAFDGAGFSPLTGPLPGAAPVVAPTPSSGTPPGGLLPGTPK